MILLADIGNSLTKIALADLPTQKIIWLKSIPTKDKNWNNHIKKMILEQKNKVTDAVISAVVTDKSKIINQIITTSLGFKSLIINSNLIKSLPMKINSNHETVGSDFIALAVGSYDKYKSSIVISLGTATTFTIINDNTLIGAIIAPGFNEAKNSLINNADLIKPFTIKPYSSVLGNTTNHALSIGYGNGFNYLLDGTIKEIEKEIKIDLPVIITGGNFQELKPFLKFKYCYDQDILMHGLMIIYQIVKKNNKLN